MIDKFSSYLRNNLASLDQKTMIPFSREFDHIQTYLELEKLRFEEELTIVYDIQADGFSLPAMTVQPLVENAVKHGITKKRRLRAGTPSVVDNVDVELLNLPSNYAESVEDGLFGLEGENAVKNRRIVGQADVLLAGARRAGGS